MTNNFKNKKILITGSTSGLGLVCAKNFIDKKATVYVCGRKKRNLALLKKDKSNKIYSNESIRLNSSQVIWIQWLCI